MKGGVFLRLRRRVAKHAQRALPIYVFCCGLFILFISQISPPQTPSESAELVKRTSYSSQPTLALGAFPRKIWQSWKVGPLGFEEKHQICARSWALKNPGYRYEVLTDSNDLQYVETHFGPDGLDRPDIVNVYQSLTAKIIKADLLRYLVMYVEGGVYVDIDVEALKPIERFIPVTDRFQEQDIDMIIGVEIDQPDFARHPILGPKSQSFCQWTFLCKPKLPVMLRLIDNIIDWLHEIADKQNVPISDINLNFDDVISGTGPSAFTQAILTEMSIREKKDISWDYFHNMDESRIVGGILVLTVEAFAAGQGHSDSGTHNSRNALVKHHYHASGWPNTHPRYKHPVYGEVEACNWEPECVKLWDFSKAVFEAMSPEEQARLIAEKEAGDGQPDPYPVDQLEHFGLEARHLKETPTDPSTDPVTSFSASPTMVHHRALRPFVALASQVASQLAPSISVVAVKQVASIPKFSTVYSKPEPTVSNGQDK
ncbi:uncharacterized protein Z518_02443 [Rhinocladiella mackenziei CBS 650.93]|uniref:Glycosyl transferase n=1 Tax=Rhinocladiella mackenziei CBS 650.93 TaxID=1442369 RepID=A0A0D2IPH3_9EURO|nr:uncharacterized protein Z518_02443 [Rhinocladiella mackenziei CBS 650.93]KIX07789.1 hypothetical protein Z518_02443 [Rhinocladiella mackenziei CBS 650.93]